MFIVSVLDINHYGYQYSMADIQPQLTFDNGIIGVLLLENGLVNIPKWACEHPQIEAENAAMSIYQIFTNV